MARPGRPIENEGKPPRRRRVWPIFFIGCISGALSVVLTVGIIVFIVIHSVQNGGGLDIPGIINTARPFTQKSTQTAALNVVSQLVVCDRAGNVSVKVDPNVTSPTITTTKTVHATDQNDANQKLHQITVEVQPPNKLQHPLACLTPQLTTGSTTTASDTALTVNVIFPSDPTGLSVDVDIALPPSTVQTYSPADIQVSLEAPLGNMSVDGISGIMNLKGGFGNITVKNAVLVSGSRLVTTQGNINFQGEFDVTPLTASQPAYYIFNSDHEIDVTLPATTSILLDANTNVGKIISDFPITPSNNAGDSNASYSGPLNPAATPQSTAQLTLDTSIGNVVIHKQ